MRWWNEGDLSTTGGASHHVVPRFGPKALHQHAPRAERRVARARICTRRGGHRCRRRHRRRPSARHWCHVARAHAALLVIGQGDDVALCLGVVAHDLSSLPVELLSAGQALQHDLRANFQHLGSIGTAGGNRGSKGRRARCGARRRHRRRWRRCGRSRRIQRRLQQQGLRTDGEPRQDVAGAHPLVFHGAGWRHDVAACGVAHDLRRQATQLRRGDEAVEQHLGAGGEQWAEVIGPDPSRLRCRIRLRPLFRKSCILVVLLLRHTVVPALRATPPLPLRIRQQARQPQLLLLAAQALELPAVGLAGGLVHAPPHLPGHHVH
mmetsp:Transcript_173199/g.555459  ORF Transcript_173199/g.555459 Transcript_173199/m.555459 type:complete len:321 (-) Transcript_173199:208-1170(-)